MQKEAALAQVLQVLQAVAAAALAQVVTCERMFSQSAVVIRAHTGYFWLCQKMGWDEMRGPIRFRGASVWASTPTLLSRMFTTRHPNLLCKRYICLYQDLAYVIVEKKLEEPLEIAGPKHEYGPLPPC